MPAPVTSLSPARTVNKTASQKPRAQVVFKKTRIVRRRGRAKGAVESDDEIQREVGTDSESDDGDSSSLDSETDDSDTEPASENVVPNHHSHARTLSSNEDALPVDKDKVSHLDGDVAPFFAPSGNWSEMVADENTNGPAELPVIEFTEFNGQTNFPNNPTARPGKNSTRQRRSSLGAPKSVSAPTSNGPVAHEDDGDREEDSGDAEAVSASTLPRRAPGQTARQAYQQRLESDPSYVPTVGGFWGHDDRLMDKDLRSLSGWWRGRWQGRGRGRGFPMRGGGRGGFHGGPSQDNGEDLGEHDGEVPPVDRPWTHDGFEEMKQREEQRCVEQKSGHQENPSFRGVGNRGGRGGFAPLRGGRGGFARGFAASPTRMRIGSPLGRVWFTMKPELMWTKQHEGFLYFDSALKPRAGQGPGYLIRLPGSQPNVIRPAQRTRPTAASASKANSISSNGSDLDPVVRLPKRDGKGKAADALSHPAETPIEEVFTVRPKLAVDPIPIPESTSAPTDIAPVISQSSQESGHQVTTDVLPQPSISSQLEQLSIEPQTSDPGRQALTEQAVLRKPSSDNPVEIHEPEPSHPDQRPVLAPLQTVFTPPPPPPPPAMQPSPVYGSPYGYVPPLPHGVAVNQHGMPYEVATGRPVYLQAPPPPMYNPRPLMHSHMPPPGIPFVPGHLRHSSAVSPDFLSQPPSHTPPMSGFIDPSTGTPIFSFPRQTSRIEIRAPTDDAAKPSKPSTRGPSGLRTTAAAFEPARPSETTENGYYPSISSPSDGSSLPSYEITSGLADDASQQPGIMAYGHYPQQQYYYPEQPQYGYPSYMEVPQVGQYDMYRMDQQAPQGTIYY